MSDWPRAWPALPVAALLRQRMADFAVYEELGFSPSGEGEHAFLHIEKTGLNTLEVQEALAVHAGVHPRDVGLSGMKDRRAITRQWFSVWLPGRADPDWHSLEKRMAVRVLDVARHDKKLKRGTHRRNRFELVLSDIKGDCALLEQRLHAVASQGFPNYFGEQRFGHQGHNIDRAIRWMKRGSSRKMSRAKRSLYLSVLRSVLFNQMLAQRVRSGGWQFVQVGDVCQMQGSNSVFAVDDMTEDLIQRLQNGDIHPALPLWGRGDSLAAGVVDMAQEEQARRDGIGPFLEKKGLQRAYRAARATADDFCWQFCEDASLRMSFRLGTGSFATALLREVINYKVEQGAAASGNSGE